MFQEHQIGAILLMAGESVRFSDSLPKQFHLLCDKPLYRYALEMLLDCGFFDEIILVCHPQWIESVAKDNPFPCQVVPGGLSRQSSSLAGLSALSAECDIALIHDAARPFVSKQILLDNLQKAIEHGAADTCIPSTDTLVFAPDGKSISSIPNRADWRRGQTPQTFRKDWILKSHEQAKKDRKDNASDDCSLVLSMGYPIAIVEGSEENFKITSKFDLAIAEALLCKVSAS